MWTVLLIKLAVIYRDGKISTTVGSVSTDADSIVYNNGKFGIRSETSSRVGVTVSDVFDFSIKDCKGRSCFDSNYTFNFLYSTFSEKSKCTANKIDTDPFEPTTGISFGLYLFVGVRYL